MTRELIEDFTKIVKPFVQKKLLEENFEGMGEQDKAEFGRDFDEILSLAIKGLESSTWIPVSERLPKDGGDYLVTLSLYVGGKEPVREVRKDFYCILSKKWLYNNDDVTAWMPLPEPYKAESENT